MEIQLIKLVIYLLKRGYGANCPDVDEWVDEEGGCASCKAKRCIDFLEEHIKLLKYDI